MSSSLRMGFLCFVALGVLVYMGVLGAPFMYDDLVYVVQNPQIKTLSLSAFTQPFSPYAPGLYRPITTLSYAIDHALFGMSPFMFHLSNIFLHACASGVLYLVAFALLGSRRAALVSAALFAVHPVHTEAVAWVSGRSEVLAGLLVLMSTLLFLRGRPVWSAVAYFGGICAKEIAVPLPLALLLWKSKQYRTIFPHGIAAVLYLGLRIFALGGLSVPLDHVRTAGLTFIERMELMLPVLVYYTRLMVLPTGLRIEYDWVSFPKWTVLLSLLTLLVIGYGAIALLKRHKKVEAFFVVWFFLFLLPVMNIIPIGELMAERFLYVPSIGACVLIGATYTYNQHKKYIRYTYILLIIVFAVLTMVRSADWSDPEVLWRSALRHSPSAPHALQNLSSLLLAQGKTGEAKELVGRAITLLDSDHPMLLSLAAQIAQAEGDELRAKELLERALGVHGDSFSFDGFQRGAALLRLERPAEALVELLHVRDRYSLSPPYWNNLGIAQAKSGAAREALKSFQRSIVLYESLPERSVEEEHGYMLAIANQAALVAVLREASAP